MIASSVTFLTPEWALVALFGVVPLAALAVASRRERRARIALALRAPGGDGRWGRAAAIAAIAALLGLAASQPVIDSTAVVNVRTDAAAIYVIDVSRSMLASRSPGAATRIARARAAAIRLRARLPQIPSGVATMTDRVLPELMPIADDEAFDRTVQEAVQVNEPPPSTDSVTATDLSALGALGTQSFFPPNAKHRVAIVLTDGESQPFDVRQTAHALGHVPGVTPIFVQLWSPHDKVFDPDGQAESAYHPDASSKEDLLESRRRGPGQGVRGGRSRRRGPRSPLRTRARSDQSREDDDQHTAPRSLLRAGSPHSAAVRDPRRAGGARCRGTADPPPWRFSRERPGRRT